MAASVPIATKLENPSLKQPSYTNEGLGDVGTEVCIADAAPLLADVNPFPLEAA